MAGSKDNGQVLADLAGKVGEIAGGQAALIAGMARINDAVIRLDGEMDRKHKENADLITIRHAENMALLELHRQDDAKNFKAIFRWMYMLAGAAGLITLLWTVFIFVWPQLFPPRTERPKIERGNIGE